VDRGSTEETGAQGSARDRILQTAYHLFSRHGIRAVEIDTIVAESHVAKMTLYRYFPSKEDLVLAFLDLRRQRWTHEWLEAGIERRAATPRERLLSVFDLLDEWFRSAVPSSTLAASGSLARSARHGGPPTLSESEARRAANRRARQIAVTHRVEECERLSSRVFKYSFSASRKGEVCQGEIVVLRSKHPPYRILSTVGRFECE
jgi:AcrR family transcriptional regulator